MIPVNTVFDALPACSIIATLIALIYGAITDIKTRTAPKWIWYIIAPFAMVTTTIWYFYEFFINAPFAISLFITSVCLCIFAVLMGYRMGNGGDWRSLYFIALLTPWISMLTYIGAALIGVIHSAIGTQRYGKDWKMPWMVSILISFVVVSAGYLFI